MERATKAGGNGGIHLSTATATKTESEAEASPCGDDGSVAFQTGRHRKKEKEAKVANL